MYRGHFDDETIGNICKEIDNQVGKINNCNSTLEVVYTSKYDTRFGQIQDNEEVFDPLLNRYNAILRSIISKVFGFRYRHKGVVETNGMLKFYLAPGLNLMLQAGINAVNRSYDFEMSDDYRGIYRVEQWAYNLNMLTEFGYKVKGQKIKLVSKQGKYYVLNSNKLKLSDNDERLYQIGELLSNVVSTYELGLKLLAEASYNNLDSSYFVGKFDNRYGVQGEAYCPSEYLGLALWELSKLKEHDDSYDDILDVLCNECKDILQECVDFIESKVYNIDIYGYRELEMEVWDFMYPRIDKFSSVKNILSFLVEYMLHKVEKFLQNRKFHRDSKGSTGSRDFSSTSFF